MKSFINFIITMIITGISTLIILIIASNIFIPKWVDHDGNMMTFIMKGFYKEKKNDLEVIFTGNSDVYRGITPMYFYNKYGVTSYNYVSAGQRSWIGYYMLEEALRYQKPKVVVFDVDELFKDNQATVGNYSKVYDNLRISQNKINCIFDSVYEKTRTEKLGHFLPILSYHSRYTELTSDDYKYAFHDYTNPTKGMDLIAEIVPYKSKEDYMEYTDEIEEIPELNIKYLNKMVELCKKNGIEFLLICIPSPVSWNYSRHNSVEKYAKEKGLKFIDFNLMIDEINLDWNKDSSDGGDHLNIYGAEKVTSYLSNYLVNNYKLTDRRKDKNFAHWNEQYKDYLKIKEKEIELAKR